MKNKKLNYILVPLVILIWILVYIRMDHGDEQATIDDKSSLRLPQSAVLPVDTYSLNLSYRDPFLAQPLVTFEPSQYKQEAQPKRKSTRRKGRRIGEVVLKDKGIELPHVTYLGAVHYPKEGEDMTGILAIETRTYSVQAGEIIEGIMIDSLLMHSIYLSYQDTNWKAIKQ